MSRTRDVCTTSDALVAEILKQLGLYIEATAVCAQYIDQDGEEKLRQFGNLLEGNDLTCTCTSSLVFSTTHAVTHYWICIVYKIHIYRGSKLYLSSISALFTCTSSIKYPIYMYTVLYLGYLSVRILVTPQRSTWSTLQRISRLIRRCTLNSVVLKSMLQQREALQKRCWVMEIAID